MALSAAPSTRQIDTPELIFEAIEAGSGPLALCLHGFPDSPFTWRHLLPQLADAGFHAVAPFMRGYAPTEVPRDGRYDRGALGADAVAIHDALDADGEAVLIGHDWGAGAAYNAGARAPDRWRRLVTLAIPPAPLDMLLFADYEQIKRFFYMFVFQSAGGEDLVAADGMVFLDRLWRDWSPGYDAAPDLVHVKQSLRERENLSAALGYYRALFAGVEGAAPPALGQFRQPTLYLHGNRDGCVGVELVRDAEEHLPPGSRAVMIDDAGHFLQLERPDEVGRLIVEWVSD